MENRNIHNPVRYAGESFEDYKARRQESNAAVKANAQTGQGGINTRKALRSNIRENGKMKFYAGAFGKGLRNWITRKQAAVLANKG